MAAIESVYRQLGARVRAGRRDRGLTQDDVAARLSPPVTRASIANLELGQQRVLVHTLVQLAHILDVPAAELLSGPVDEPASWRAVEDALQAALHLSRPRAARLARRLEASS